MKRSDKIQIIDILSQLVDEIESLKCSEHFKPVGVFAQHDFEYGMDVAAGTIRARIEDIKHIEETFDDSGLSVNEHDCSNDGFIKEEWVDVLSKLSDAILMLSMESTNKSTVTAAWDSAKAINDLIGKQPNVLPSDKEYTMTEQEGETSNEQIRYH